MWFIQSWLKEERWVESMGRQWEEELGWTRVKIKKKGMKEKALPKKQHNV